MSLTENLVRKHLLNEMVVVASAETTKKTVSDSLIQEIASSLDRGYTISFEQEYRGFGKSTLIMNMAKIHSLPVFRRTTLHNVSDCNTVVILTDFDRAIQYCKDYKITTIFVDDIDEDVADDFRVIGINPIGFTIKENTEDFDSMMNQVNKAFVEIEENKHITKSMLDNLTTKKRLVRNTYGDYSSANISYGHEKDLSVFQLRRMRLANRKKEFLFAYKAFNEELEAVKSKINKIQSALEKQ